VDSPLNFFYMFSTLLWVPLLIFLLNKQPKIGRGAIISAIAVSDVAFIFEAFMKSVLGGSSNVPLISLLNLIIGCILLGVGLENVNGKRPINIAYCGIACLAVPVGAAFSFISLLSR
jgi:hypothetical protein